MRLHSTKTIRSNNSKPHAATDSSSKRAARRNWRLAVMFVLTLTLFGVALIRVRTALAGNVNFVTAWGSKGTGDGQFNGPEGIAMDNSGNVYVADVHNNRIEKFTSDGIFITSWGGTGSGEGQFNGPFGIAADSSGNVYVSDRGNARVQKFTSSGTFVTKWGNGGSGNGQFQAPSGVAADNSGNVYVVDTNLCRIQKFTSTGAFITKWGSTGSRNGQFFDPFGVAVDRSGDVYVADFFNDCIQKFTSTGAFITKWGSTGFGDGQFRGPAYVAVDGSNNVYVTDYWNKRVEKFASNGAFITKWGGGGFDNGAFTSPNGIAVDGSGNVYVTDQLTNRIQKFGSNSDPGRPLATKWGSEGSADGQFNTEHGIAVDSSGNAYVADTFNNRIEKFSSTGAFITKWGSAGSGDGQFTAPRGVAVNRSGNTVFVADTGNNRIQVFNSSGTFLGKFGSSGSGDGQFNQPWGIVVDNGGTVIVADSGNHRIEVFNSSGTFIGKVGSAGSGDGQFFSPEGIALDTIGNVYVADDTNQRIQKFTSAGTFLTKWGSRGSGNGEFRAPVGVAVDSSGNVYVVDEMTNLVQEFSSGGTFIAKWGSFGSGNGQFSQPGGVAVDTTGHVYVADTGNSRIQKFGPDLTAPPFGTKWGSTGSGDGQFNTPFGLALDSSGNVYVADLQMGSSRVEKFSPTGAFLQKFVSTGAQFVVPAGAAIDSAGNVYTADNANNVITKFTTGKLLAKWGGKGSGNGQFNGPAGLAIDSSDNVYVTDQGNNRIQKFSSAGTFITKWGSSGSGNGQFNTPQGVAVDNSNNVYVADTGNNRVQKFSFTGAFITKWGSMGNGDGQFNEPQFNLNLQGIAVDSSGNVYVADQSNQNPRIQKFTSNGTFITKWGSQGSGDAQFQSPTGMAVDSSGNVYVADGGGNNRVEKFSPGQPPVPVTNGVPVANAGPNQTLQSKGATTAVTLNGTASSDSDGDSLDYAWSEGTTVLGEGATLNVSLRSGIHVITLAVTDPFLNSATANVTITIADMLSTAAGNNVTVTGSSATVKFGSVTTAGTTTITPVNPVSVARPSGSSPVKGGEKAEELPAGFLLTNTSQAFYVTTTADVQAPINICFNMSSITDSIAFSHLSVLHDEDGTLVDRTTSRDPGTGMVCASVDSLGTFVIATTPTFQVQFNAPSYSVDEGAGFATIEVTQLGNQVDPVSVDYATSDGTAQQRKDYTLAVGTLNFGPGEMTKTITILITDNVYIDGNRTVNLSLSNPNGGMTLGTPNQIALTIIDNDTVPPTTNPLDNADAQFFVRQHYYDFLSRLPDPSGLDFWTNEITSCGADQACIVVKRVNVSAAYFLSIEFQQTGYLVERLYKAAYGDSNGASTFGGAHQLPVPIVRYNEFMPDTQRIGQGVVVGATGWEQVLESNKQNFTTQFVQRSRFTTSFPTAMTPTQFVNQLFANAGVTPTASDLAAAIGEFGAVTNTSDVVARARALRDVAENPSLNQQEFNRAFVLTQYFGYLRRNPNDSPDSDYSGYEFWLNKLNQFNGNFVSAEMVKAFITSTEYRQRFGP